MKKVAIALTYYNSPKMLAEQVKHWKCYPDSSVEVILVDDGSMIYPAEKELKDLKLPVEVYRITKDIPQNTWGARNLAFHIALIEKFKWVLCLDIDHVLSCGGLMDLLSEVSYLNTKQYYTPTRWEVKTEGLELMGRHSDSFLINPELYWKAGGYDEDLTGYYFQGCATYFRKSLNRISRRVDLKVPTLFYPSELIEDASPLKDCLKSIAPEQPRNKKPKVLKFDWERVL